MSFARPLLFAVSVSLLALGGCGSPKVKCLPSNCQGCCDTDGECIVVPSEQACGLRGNSCEACFPGQTCLSGFCTTTGFGGGGGETGGGGGEIGGGGGETGGGGGETGGGGGTVGGGGGTTGGGGGTVGGGGGTVGGGGGTVGGGGGMTGGGGGGTPDTAAQLTAVRAAADQGGTTVTLPVQGALVTYVKPLVPDAGTTDPAGFFVQAGGTGPALFVAVVAGSLPVTVGDRVDFTVTSVARIGQLRVATGVSGFLRQSGGNPVSGLTQSVTGADFTQAGVLDGFESELVSISGTLTSDFAFGGAGFQSAAMTTSGNADAGALRVRLTSALAGTQGLSAGCSVQVTATPLWRFNAQAQPSAFNATELAGTTCPTPVLLSATALTSTSVRAVFNRPMNPNAISTSTLSIAGLTVSAVTGSGTTWTLTTSAHTSGQAYTLTASTSVADIRGTPISSSGRTAGFTGFVVPVGGVVINEVDYDNVGTDNDEFVELLNAGNSGVNLSGYSLVLINGSTNAPYNTVALPAVTLAPGAYFVLGSATLVATLPGGTASATFSAASNNLQNDAEGLVLVNGAGVWLDAMTWEQANPATLTWEGQQVTEGDAGTNALVDSNTLNVSIGRIPNGTDTNRNALDFTVNSAPTPGAANVP